VVKSLAGNLFFHRSSSKKYILSAGEQRIDKTRVEIVPILGAVSPCRRVVVLAICSVQLVFLALACRAFRA
jgi:hypothetical protein